MYVSQPVDARKGARNLLVKYIISTLFNTFSSRPAPAAVRRFGLRRALEPPAVLQACTSSQSVRSPAARSGLGLNDGVPHAAPGTDYWSAPL